MPDDPYNRGSRQLQDVFDSRRLADRLTETTYRATFTEADRRLVEGATMLFLATADEQGWPDCSYKGGEPGFVRVTGDSTLAFPSYDGNGQFRSLGNLLVNPRLGLLFIDFERSRRLRVNGTASLVEPEAAPDHKLEGVRFEGAQLLVVVHAERIFANCPRYIHRMAMVERSEYAPRPGHTPPVPKWKLMEEFLPYLPRQSDHP